MGRAKIVYVQLANKRTVEVKIHEDGAMSIAQVQDGDFIKIPQPYVDEFVEALKTITAQQQQGQISQGLSAVAAAWQQAIAQPQPQPAAGAITLHCSQCQGSGLASQYSWSSCDTCGTVVCSRVCQGRHMNAANCNVTGWRPW